MILPPLAFRLFSHIIIPMLNCSPVFPQYKKSLPNAQSSAKKNVREGLDMIASNGIILTAHKIIFYHFFSIKLIIFSHQRKRNGSILSAFFSLYPSSTARITAGADRPCGSIQDKQKTTTEAAIERQCINDGKVRRKRNYGSAVGFLEVKPLSGYFEERRGYRGEKKLLSEKSSFSPLIRY